MFHLFQRERDYWLLSFPEPIYTPESFQRFLDDFCTLIYQCEASRELLELRVDLSNLGAPPNYGYIQQILTFMSETKEAREAACGKTVIVVPNGAIKGIISTVLFLEPPCRPVEIVVAK